MLNNNCLIFLSHIAQDAPKIVELVPYFKEFNIKTFLAHEDITPETEWVIKIENNLNQMDLLLAFITKGFHSSVWTNQEIGWALGREGIKVGKLMFNKTPPEGFGSKFQAKVCNWDDSNLFNEILLYILDNNLLPETNLKDLYAKHKAFKSLMNENTESYIAIDPFCKDTVSSQDKYIRENTVKGQYKLFVNNYHSNGFFHTSCLLYKGNEFCANVQLAYEGFGRGDYLNNNKKIYQKLHLLPPSFFSMVSFNNDVLNSREKEHVKTIFNHCDSEDEMIRQHPYDEKLIKK